MQTYQVKLYPTQKQELKIDQFLFQATGVYNWAIKSLERTLDLNQSYCFPINRMKGTQAKYYLNGLTPDHSKKCNLPIKVIQGMITQATTAKSRQLEGVSGRPRLKGIHNKLSSLLFEGDFYIKGNRIKIAGLPGLKYRGNVPPGKLKQIRLIRKASGYYASCVFDSVRAQIEITGHNIIGIDPGLSTALTLSSGVKIENPRFFETQEKLIGQAQRGLNKRLTAKRHERLSNKRKDWQHKLSLKLVKENKEIYWSSDNIKGLAKLFGKSYNSLGLYGLSCMIESKVERRSVGPGVFMRVASRNSTKTCSSCGQLSGPNGLHGLQVRQWKCACGALHDRDVNAAINTLLLGQGLTLRDQVTGYQKSYKTTIKLNQKAHDVLIDLTLQ